jgi:hypothetical protein
MMEDVRTICGFALASETKGDVVWGRMITRPEERDAYLFMEREFRAMNLDKV